MADIVKFPESNKTFVGEGCLDLPVFQGKTADNHDVIVSCWKLSPEEVSEIIATGRVWLYIWGTGQPPVCVVGHRPFATQVVDN